MKHLNLSSFKEKIFDFETNKEWNFKGDKPAIIDFYADWCGPCRAVAPVMKELSNDYSDLVDVYKIDTEQEQELSSMFAIKSIPAVLFIPINGKPRMSVGVLPKKGYQEAIKELFAINIPEESI